jgi:hypothetical protein
MKVQGGKIKQANSDKRRQSEPVAFHLTGTAWEVPTEE